MLSGKIVSEGLFEKLLFHSETISRGEHALFYAASRHFTDDERRRVWEMINETYSVFLDRVTASRDLSREDVDAVGGGRVWSGRQALEHGLIDELGGLARAVDKAREFAGLNCRSRVRVIETPKRDLAPLAGKAADAIGYALDGLGPLRGATALFLLPIVAWPEDLG